MAVELPISPEKLKSRTLSNKFWGSEPSENYFARVKNILIRGSLDRQIIAAVMEDYHGDLVVDFQNQWRELLQEIVYWIAYDGKVDRQEQKYFKEYISIFKIPSSEAVQIYKAGARRAYLDLVERYTRDGQISDSDIDFLERVAKHFGLSAQEKQLALNDQISAVLQAHLDAMLEDGVISDQEWDDFERHRKNLRTRVEIGEGDKLVIEAARDRWRARFGEIKSIELVSEYRLKQYENAYFQGVAHWYENRSRKGVQALELIAQGELVLTNQRVLFRGANGENKSLGWTSIHAVTEYGPSRFELEKERGKSPVIDVLKCFHGRSGVATSLAQRLLEQTL